MISGKPCPTWPPDLFGAMAHLLDTSSGYHRIDFQAFKCGSDRPPRNDRFVSLSDEELGEVADIAREWRGDAFKSLDKVPERVEGIWKAFIEASANAELAFSSGDDPDAPTWMQHALHLFLIADEACKDVGYALEADDRATWIDSIVDGLALEAVEQKLVGLSNIALELNPNEVTVVPKSVQPEVGCTLRSLSRNLAVSPGQGVARTHWTHYPQNNFLEPDKPLGILLVPFPYAIGSHCFRVEALDKKSGTGWYEVDQNWFDPTDKDKISEFADFIVGLIDKAEAQGTIVNALVFPEMALSPLYFMAVLNKIHSRPTVMFCVAGLSQPILEEVMNAQLEADNPHLLKTNEADVVDPNSPKGNYVATYVKFQNGVPEGGGDPVLADIGQRVTYRAKHHWWILERSQIEGYALGDALDPQYVWKEKLSHSERSVDMVSINKALTFTSLICEDLARIDPCQQLVRAVGPDLVFALLMDGPQVRARWSAKYATVLAEDPGSAVLSLTSKGLIQRQNESEMHKHARTVALLRDAVGKSKELNLPDGDHAILLKIRAAHGEKHHPILDVHNNTFKWTYIGHAPVRSDAPPAWLQECKPRQPLS